MTAPPPPMVPPEVDVSDMPLPREAFIRLAMEEFGVSLQEATELVDIVLGGVNRVH